MAERQADSATIIRNFLTETFHPFYPRIDWRGNTSGAVESELQAYTFMAAVISRVTDIPYELVGRVLSILCFLFTLLYYYRFVSTLLSKQVAYLSVVILAWLPVYVYFSRVIMPESLLMFLTIATMYHVLKWIEHSSRRDLFLWVALLTLTILVKPYMAHIGLPIMVMIWKKRGCADLRDAWFWLAAFLSCFSLFAYYYHAHSLFLTTGLTFGIFEPGGGKWLNLSFYSFLFVKKLLVTRLFFQHANWAFILAIWGWILAWKDERSSLFRWWLLSVALYVLIVNMGNFVHIHYQLPALFVIAYFAAHALQGLLHSARRLVRASGVFLLSAFIGTSLLVTALEYSTETIPSSSFLEVLPKQFQSFAAIEPQIFSSDELATVTSCMDRHVSTNERILVAGRTSPVLFYSARRKGWREPIESLDDSLLHRRRIDGARWLLVNTRSSEAAESWTRTRTRLTRLSPVLDTLGIRLLRMD